ncbi:MAG: YihY/virulence factor BrkB family protein [Bacteroidota bacterium]|nr:YihY/virulence factor BrkB family protein [Bacteroidota bacterium]
MKFKIKDLGKIFKITFKEWNQKDPFRQSAIIAYYSIFSIPGLLVLIITITGYFFSKEAVHQNIFDQVSSTMGADTAEQIKGMLTKAGGSQSTIWGSIIGFVILLVGATGVFVELQKTLNEIWQVKVVVKKGILPILKARLFSFGLILAIAFLLLISLVVSAALVAMSNWIAVDASGFVVIVFNVLNFILSLVVISILFGLMFKILPDAKVKWEHVWLGSLVTGLLFTIGKTALAFYFGKTDPASVYGAAGSIILILLWVSYSSMIMFFGAEFTATYAKMYSGDVPPSKIAKKEIHHKHD